MQNPSWRGVYSAITTKLDAAQDVDYAAVRGDVTWQIESGVHGIICCGSLGEASTLVADEKIAIARAALKAAAETRPGHAHHRRGLRPAPRRTWPCGRRS